jgi:hypothetical protein
MDPVGPAELDDDGQVPSWAGPAAARDGDAPKARRGPGSGAHRSAARSRRRRVVMMAGLAVVTGVVVALVLLLSGQPGPAQATPGALVTTFQSGEFQQVPNACDSVPTATVQRYLPGKAKVTSPLPVSGSAQSSCNWTIDSPPVYRLLELNVLAYAPSGLASGNGSATSAAIDAYNSALQTTRNPPKHSPDPPAAVTTLTGLGNQAFSSMRVFREGGAVTDVATVVARYHNVIVTVTLNGLDHSNRGSYGPVSQSDLAATALAFAQAAEAALR